METAKTNKRVTVGVGLLLAVTLVLGWFVGRFVPGEPQSPEPKPSFYIYPHGRATFIPIADIDAVGLGVADRIEGLVQGSKYEKTSPSVEYEVDLKKEEAKVEVKVIEVEDDPLPDVYNVEFPSFELTIQSARVVSLEAFAEWYPDYAGGVSDNSKVVLVDVTAANLSEDQVFSLERFLLASDAFNQVSPGCLGNGCGISTTVLESLSAAPRHQAGEAYDFSPLFSVEPGETRTLTLPYVVSSSYFADVADFEELDLARFSLEIGDYATGTLHRFALV